MDSNSRREKLTALQDSYLAAIEAREKAEAEVNALREMLTPAESTLAEARRTEAQAQRELEALFNQIGR